MLHLKVAKWAETCNVFIAKKKREQQSELFVNEEIVLKSPKPKRKVLEKLKEKILYWGPHVGS
jgi:hypothetical protein